MHLTPDPVVDGHFNVLRGAIGGDVQRAGVKVVSGFAYNYEHGLPSEGAVLALFDPKTGKTQATLDAGGITDMLTGAVTAIGAKYLARQASKVLATSARGARRTGMYGCSPACSLRRDPCPLAPPGEPARVCRAAAPGSRHARARMRDLAGHDRRRGHRGRGILPA